MGITGLLPYLKKIHTSVNISRFEGCTAAIDAYCWLHKGAFSCADKLALGEPTEQYVYYCMKYVDCLLKKKVRPILVFDGCHLPSKKDVEITRRERRETYRKKAAALLREGRRTEARECLQRCIDISSQMALNLIKACRARGVDCIVAPYEADAQLAYLSRTGLADIIITEDSDLLPFGCHMTVFKMDLFGNGILVERSRLNEVLQIREDVFTFEKFRHICILSGCDYLPSISGIGLAKANKVFKMARQPDLKGATCFCWLLKKLPSYLKMKVDVTDEYVAGFIQAENTFLHQLVFDPVQRRVIPVQPYPLDVDPSKLRYAGPTISSERGLQIALANIDLQTGQTVADFQLNTWKRPAGSIWDVDCRPRPFAVKQVNQSDISHSEVVVKNPFAQRKSPVKRKRKEVESEDARTDTELANMYDGEEPSEKKMCRGENHESDQDTENSETSSPPSPEKSKISKVKVNKFAVSPDRNPTRACNSPPKQRGCAGSDQLSASGSSASKYNKFAVISPPNGARERFTLGGGARKEVRSRYFASAGQQKVSVKVEEASTKDITASTLNTTNTSDTTVSAHGVKKTCKRSSVFSWSDTSATSCSKKSPLGVGLAILNSKHSTTVDTVHSEPSNSKHSKSITVDPLHCEQSKSDNMVRVNISTVESCENSVTVCTSTVKCEEKIDTDEIRDVCDTDMSVTRHDSFSVSTPPSTTMLSNLKPGLQARASSNTPKRCRVSGLSSKASNKQRNIKDMFKQFSFKKTTSTEVIDLG